MLQCYIGNWGFQCLAYNATWAISRYCHDMTTLMPVLQGFVYLILITEQSICNLNMLQFMKIA